MENQMETAGIAMVVLGFYRDFSVYIGVILG